MAWLLTIALEASADSEVLGRQLWALGTTGIAEVEQLDGPSLIAGFDDRSTADEAALAIGPIATVTAVDASSWATPEPQELMVGGQLLTIEVAQAFGHGHHPTTRLALEAVTRLASNTTRVLDVGTGTGILAMAAAALGAYPVVGVDIDPEAIAVAQRNVVNNHLEVEIVDLPLGSIERQFDLVVLNMLAAELAPIADLVADRLLLGGSLIVTGFLIEQREWVESLFPALAVVERSEGDQRWARSIFTSGPADD